MIEKILRGVYEGVELLHVPMRFSREMDEIGSASIGKVIHLFRVIAEIYYFRFFKKGEVLYYPPAGPNRIPIMRDVIILISTRWLFNKTVFHFHAGGVSEVRIKSWLFGFLFRWAYYGSDCAILLSELNPADGRNLKAKREIVIPYGIEDNVVGELIRQSDSSNVKILCVGVIKESKGVLVLLDACRSLKSKGLDFRLEVMGKFDSLDFEKVVRNLIVEYKLTSHVSILGVLAGDSKWEVFKRADIFCFPTFFESETFGVVLLEAMQFCLPVVATAWRGIPSIVIDGKSGFLVAPGNSDMLADKLEILILNSMLRQEMGKFGRNNYLAHFTLNEFRNRMGEIFRTC